MDFIFSTTPYERQAIARAEPVVLAGVPVPFATAEDLLIHKLFAGRPRDLEDAAGVVRRKGINSTGREANSLSYQSNGWYSLERLGFARGASL